MHQSVNFDLLWQLNTGEMRLKKTSIMVKKEMHQSVNFDLLWVKYGEDETKK